MSATPSKGVAALLSQRGGNMKESMGVGAFPGGTPPMPAAPASPQYVGTGRARDALVIEVGKIIADPDQPRRTFDEEPLAELAESLKARGQLQPIRVRWSADLGSWVVISGERRWRAAQMAGLATLACVEVKGALAPDDILEDQILENLIREDLKPMEAARAFDSLMQMRGLSLRQLGDYLQTSHTRIQKAISLLKLPAAVQNMIERDEIAPAVATEIGQAPPEQQVRIAEQARDEGLTRDQTAEVVRREKAVRGPAVAGKGRGAKAGPPKAWTRKTTLGKLTLELRRQASDAEVADVLREIAGQIDQTTSWSKQDPA